MKSHVGYRLAKGLVLKQNTNTNTKTRLTAGTYRLTNLVSHAFQLRANATQGERESDLLWLAEVDPDVEDGGHEIQRLKKQKPLTGYS